MMSACSFGSLKPNAKQKSVSDQNMARTPVDISSEFNYFISSPLQLLALEQTYNTGKVEHSVLASDERAQAAQKENQQFYPLLAQSQKSAERNRVSPHKGLEKGKAKAIKKPKRKSEKPKSRSGDSEESSEPKEIEIEDDSELFTFFVKAPSENTDKKELLVQSPLSARSDNTRAMLAFPPGDKLASYSQSLFWNLKRHSFIAELTMLAVVFFGFMVILWVRLQYEVARPFSTKMRLDKTQ
jgi:hypothetical protein